MRILLWLYAVIFAVSIVAETVHAGEIYHNEDQTQWMFSGKIENNDAMKLLHVPNNSILMLNSVGGNAWEGLIMGHIIYSKNLTIRIAEGGICQSACAFAAIMSNNLKGKYEFHAPYPVGYTPSTEEKVYVEGIFIDYMKSSKRLSDKEITEIMNTGPDDLLTGIWE